MDQVRKWSPVGATAVTQVRDDGSLDLGGVCKGGEKWSGSGYILKAEPLRLPEN